MRHLLLCLLVGSFACTGDAEVREARKTYNESITELEAKEHSLAEKGFLEARDNAGQDPELRFRAAFNLGMAFAQHGETATENPEETMELLRQSAAWFRDAVRLRPEDEDARVNLEVILSRIQLLADELNKGKNSLEARLTKVIDDQRGLLDSIRKLMGRVEEAGATSEPVAFAEEFDGLAVFERTLLAEADVVGDLAGEELNLIENKTEEERTDEERMRSVQLKNLSHYLDLGRTGLADTRRLLRRLLGDEAHRRADAALADLKRAREQLLDPITVLKSVAEDQTVLLMHTNALAELAKGAIRLDGGETAKTPPWLTPEHLSDRQLVLLQRSAEITARFSAGVQASTSSTAQVDPQQQRVLQAAEEAIPHLSAAVRLMENARNAYSMETLPQAMQAEQLALVELFKAIERFAATRDLIELAYRDQSQIVALLTPPEEMPEEAKEKELSTEERMRVVKEAITQNHDRLARLFGLLQEEQRQAEAQVQQAAQQAQQQGGQAPPEEETKKQLESIHQKFTMAEMLRVNADKALVRLTEQLATLKKKAPQKDSPLTTAEEGLKSIEELRRLFFSIIEHLKELLANQSSTRDKTGSVHNTPDEERAMLLGPLADAQTRHGMMGEALAKALSEQADAAAAAQEPQAQEAAGKLAEAAEELRSGTQAMAGAAKLLHEGKEQAAVASYDVEPALESQQTAIEHLENAIRILEPPQQQQQQQQQQEQKEEQVSQRQADRRLQAIRDREAERERKRRNKQKQPEPVEKDW